MQYHAGFSAIGFFTFYPINKTFLPKSPWRIVADFIYPNETIAAVKNSHLQDAFRMLHLEVVGHFEMRPVLNTRDYKSCCNQIPLVQVVLDAWDLFRADCVFVSGARRRGTTPRFQKETWISRREHDRRGDQRLKRTHEPIGERAFRYVYPDIFTGEKIA